MDRTAPDVPPGTAILGYEPSTFYAPRHDSPVAETLFFPLTLENDEERSRFRMYHERLNVWGLFDAPAEAESYLADFLSSVPPDWDEHEYTYYIVEVHA